MIRLPINVSEAEAAALAYEKKLERRKAGTGTRRSRGCKRAAAAAGNNNSGSGDITSNINKTPISYDTSDLAMLAAIIECEAGNQSYEGKLAVGSVVVNRVNSHVLPTPFPVSSMLPDNLHRLPAAVLRLCSPAVLPLRAFRQRRRF